MHVRLPRSPWWRHWLTAITLAMVLATAVQLFASGYPTRAAAASAPSGNILAAKVAKLRGLLSAGNQTSPPHYSHSWYIDNVSATALYGLGYNDGLFDRSYCDNGLAILDFGQVGVQYSTSGPYGTYLVTPGTPFVSDSQIQAAVETYARGWRATAGQCPRLHVAPGTSNFHECPYGGQCTPYAAGMQWAITANNVEAYFTSQGWTWQVNAWAADDMETGWDPAWKTRQFVDGFTSADSGRLLLLDFGDASQSTTWSDADVYYVSWQAGWDVAYPEIYSQSAADRWVTVKQEYYNGAAGAIAFTGVMAECQQADPIPTTTCGTPAGENAPNQAWLDLWNTMNGWGVGQASLDFSSDIRYQVQFG